MKKMKYISPAIEMVEVKYESAIAAISNTMPEGPEGGTNFGGDSDSGTNPLGSKENSYSAWDTWDEPFSGL